MKEVFRRLARRASELVGSTWAFMLALSVLAVWGLTGPVFHYSDTWQLVINTSTSVVTFLMVFLIQNTQNRDTLSIHLKLDELIRSLAHARNSMIDLDRLSDEELRQLHDHYVSLSPQPRGDGIPPAPEAPPE